MAYCFLTHMQYAASSMPILSSTCAFTIRKFSARAL
uniref:Uncharacterized protein n=1 Tax=Anguilla anguilla TaxID=7936 RepID=A0A0E9VE94_ANGAN